MKGLFLYMVIFSVLLCSGCKQKDALQVVDLKCENLRNPTGVGNLFPRFSWNLKSCINGTTQQAYQILVASSDSLLENDRADLWNTGKISSSSMVLISYNGENLNSGIEVFWKVRVWDNTGNPSSWSPVSRFSMGLFDKEDWKAMYIGFPTEAGYCECPQLKKTFNLNKPDGRMFLHVNSLGYHEVYLNGQKVGDAVLTPAVSQFDKRSWAVTYDVSGLLKQGENELLLWLGSGWYTEGLPGVVNNGPVVKAQLERLSGKQREVILATGPDWSGRKSSYTRHGNWRPNRFGGEILDGTIDMNAMSTGITGGRNWTSVSVIPVPDHEVCPQRTELNRIQETVVPKEMRLLSKDTFLIDMGKCLTGWNEIRFPALEKLQEIVLEYSDHLDKNGNFVDQKQTDRYIASGGGNEVFINKFNYHGYRYIRISNLAEAPQPDSVKAFLVHTGYEPAAGFQCSDPEMNQIHDMILYSLRCLSLGGDLVDCPQIERLGYGGDGNASTETAQTMFNLNPLYANWLQAWADCIRDDGGMPHTAPNPYPAGGGPYWCGFIITASWRTYLNYGDDKILRKYYPVMQHWLDYVENHSPEGLLQKWPDTDYRGWYLGDWACPEGVDQTDRASVDLVNNCFIAVCYDNMEKIAGVLGIKDDTGSYRHKKEQLQRLIHQAFFDASKNSYGTGSMIDLTYPLLSGVVPANLTEAVNHNLVTEIMQNRKGHFACGLVGIPVFTEWAVQNREVDLMYSMLKKRDYPGYLFMIANGATTTWEHWNGDRSRIHNCYNGIGSWFYQAVGGIRKADGIPAYRKVFIQPQVPRGITWAKTWKSTPYGKLVVNWEVKRKMMLMELEIPPGMEAGVIIPAGIKKYHAGRKSFDLTGENPAVIQLESGKQKLYYSL